MPRLRIFSGTRSPFTSLRIRNYRLYFAGQLTSNIGTWLHTLAQAQLVLELTGSARDLGISMGMQFLPLLFLGVHGGALADRIPPRLLMMITGAGASLSMLILGTVTALGYVNIWWVWGMSFCLGLSYAFDRPAAQAILYELVGPENLANAVGLNSLVQSSARFIGPALGGLIYATAGPQTCFFLNSVSFLFVIGALLCLRVADMWPRLQDSSKGGKPIREGLAYAWRDPVIRLALLVNALIGCLAFNFVTVITALVVFVFEEDPTTVGLAHSISAGGAVLGAMVIASLRITTAKALIITCFLFGSAIAVEASAPNITFFLVLAPFLGFFMTSYLTTIQAIIQKATEPAKLGRVLSLFNLGMFGTTPIGGFLIGWVVDTWSAREGLYVGALSCFISCALLMFYYREISGRVEAHGVRTPAREQT